MDLTGLRRTESDLLLRVERLSARLQRENPNWSNEKCIAEVWLRYPKLYERYYELRAELAGRKQLPILIRGLGGES
jgi:hypothetical protein